MGTNPSLNEMIVRGFVDGMMRKNPQSVPMVDEMIRMGKRMKSIDGEIAMSILSMYNQHFVVADLDSFDPRMQTVFKAMAEAVAPWDAIADSLELAS